MSVAEKDRCCRPWLPSGPTRCVIRDIWERKPCWSAIEEREAGMGERQPLYHLSLVSSLAVAQGERERKRERENLPRAHLH